MATSSGHRRRAAAILGVPLFGRGVLPAQYCPCDYYWPHSLWIYCKSPRCVLKMNVEFWKRILTVCPSIRQLETHEQSRNSLTKSCRFLVKIMILPSFSQENLKKNYINKGNLNKYILNRPIAELQHSQTPWVFSCIQYQFEEVYTQGCRNGFFCRNGFLKT